MTLTYSPSDFINGTFVPIVGDAIVSRDPSQPSRIIWQGTPDVHHVDDAVNAAANAFDEWSARTFDERAAFLRRWADVTAKHASRIAELITDEMGKTLAESLFEAKALSEKVNITLDRISVGRVSNYEVPVSATRVGKCRFKPHGVMAVIGPFNFPAHLPNGHFVPALLLGNTIVLKPSEKTPAVGQLLAELMHEINVPPGVFNVVQGGADIASKLIEHERINGVLFTGSWPVGRRILEANLDRPGRIIALEMGGNNPSVVMNDAHFKQAVIENVRSAFATTGQRCTCTRRIIVQRGIADRFISSFCKAASSLRVGSGRSIEPVFMGPIIHERSLQAVLDFQHDLVKRGGRVLLEATRMNQKTAIDSYCSGHFVTPGLVEVDRFTLDHDCEVFGPFVQLSIVDDLDDAIQQANASRYGLAASIFTSNAQTYEEFFRRCHAGCINWNTGTAGASGRLPFGGVDRSGNHRPAGAFSVDYCGYPVANMIEHSADAALPAGMTWNEGWMN